MAAALRACSKRGVPSSDFNSPSVAPVAGRKHRRGSVPGDSRSFTSTGSIGSGTVEAARVDLPAGFLNQIGRTIRVKAQFIYTPYRPPTLILSVTVRSVYNGTEVTI